MVHFYSQHHTATQQKDLMMILGMHAQRRTAKPMQHSQPGHASAASTIAFLLIARVCCIPADYHVGICVCGREYLKGISRTMNLCTPLLLSCHHFMDVAITFKLALLSLLCTFLSFRV
jgi:hypothetical protein